MKKIKLHGLGNEKYFNYYIFDKTQKVAEKIAKILKLELGIHWDFSKEYEDNNGKWINENTNVTNNKDVHEIIPTLKNRVDIFYGSKKMFILLHCSEKDRLNFNEELFKISIMSKPKKFKPLEK